MRERVDAPGAALREDFEVACAAASLAGVRDQVAAFVGRAGIERELGGRLVLAVDEALTSMVLDDQACWQQSAGTLCIELDANPTRFRALLRSSTTIYPGLHSPAEEGASGEEGVEHTRARELGIFLIRRICDEVNYSFRRGYENELELVKFLERRVTDLP